MTDKERFKATQLKGEGGQILNLWNEVGFREESSLSSSWFRNGDWHQNKNWSSVDACILWNPIQAQIQEGLLQSSGFGFRFSNRFMRSNWESSMKEGIFGFLTLELVQISLLITFCDTSQPLHSTGSGKGTGDLFSYRGIKAVFLPNLWQVFPSL